MKPVKSIKPLFYVYGLYRDAGMTNPFYIGKGYGRRVGAHEKPSEIAKRYNARKNNTIQKLIADIGFLPKKIIAGELSEAEAFALEIRLITKHGRLDIGTGCLTNLSEGGLGATHSAETREKIRLARSRQVCSEETREKMRKASTGRKHSAETRAKMSAICKARENHFSPEARARQLAAVTGRKASNEERARLSALRTGKKLSKEHVEAIARWHRGKKRSDQARANMRAGREASAKRVNLAGCNEARHI